MGILIEKKVILKSLKKTSWSGFSRFPKCKDTVIVRHGRDGYNTGLTNEEQSELENLLGLSKGKLSNYSDYWENFVINIYDKNIELDLNKPKDMLDYKIFLESSKVANSEDTRSQWPKAQYILYDKNADAKKANIKVKAKKAAWVKFSRMDINDMKQILKLMGRKVTDIGDEIIENTLESIVEETPEEFNKIIDIDHFEERIMIEDLLAINVLRKQGTKYLYGDDVLGYTLDEAITYLVDPANQELLIIFKNKLDS